MAVRSAVDDGAEGAGTTRFGSVMALLRRHGGESMAAGAVVARLLESHPHYVERGIVPSPLDDVGPTRSVGEHLAYAEQAWDPALVPVLHGRHVVLALALDSSLGWSLLRAGVIASLLRRWQPGSGTTQEPYRLVWDVLDDAARAAADEQPLLAAAFGAPPEWTAQLPGDVTEMAWSPGGDQVAVLVGEQVFSVAAGRGVQRINDVNDGVTSLGWAADGLVALHVAHGTAELRQVETRATLGTMASVSGGRVSGDGSHAWLEQTGGVIRWSPSEPDSLSIGPPCPVLAVDTAGQFGLLRWAEHQVVVSGRAPMPDLSRGQGQPDWPSDAAPMVGWLAAGPQPCALVTLGRLMNAVAAPADGGIHISDAPWPPLATLVTGPGRVTALAADPSGTALAVARGRHVGIWTLSRQRARSRSIPGYDSDRASGPDLLGADQDARALAALIASRDLRPPLAIGLFGSWGSGKTFVLNRIDKLLVELTGPSGPDGYLRHVATVRFNAWQYAEANLWASLVDHVLQRIGPARSPEDPQEVKDADRKLAVAQTEAGDVGTAVTKAQKALGKAQDALTRRRRIAWRLVAAGLLLAAFAVLAAVIGGPGRVVAGASAALALLGSAYAALGQARLAKGHADELVEAGKAGLATVSGLVGGPEELAARAAAARLQDLLDTQRRVDAESTRLRVEAARLHRLALDEPLGALLHNLATVTEYRDELSLVARTRERFDRIDSAVRSSRQRLDGEAAPAGTDPQLERVVIVIDDLDRCPPEKVVTVLEAVHLLFDFEMFVVVLAVDTRWLDQSLRMRYRQLLGETNTAAPSDYLEKIIQVPVQLPPLDEGMVRTMIAGLTGRAVVDPTAATTADPAPEAASAAVASPTGTEAERARPTRPPLRAEVLTIEPAEALALSAVAPLVGTTPRTVKRFVNTYQLIKASSQDPLVFADPESTPGPAGLVAFLLAVLISRPAAAHLLFEALDTVAGDTDLQTVVGTLHGSSDPVAGPRPETADLRQAIEDISGWLVRNPDHASAPARDGARWAGQVARFSFTPVRQAERA